MTALVLAALLSAAPSDSLYALKLPLVDQDGRAVQLDQFRGHPVLITMFYGSCPQACPLLIAKMKLFEKHLTPQQRADLRVILVSFDPARDTPEALKKLAAAHGVDEARWRFLRADDDSVRLLAGALGIKYHRINDGSIWHSSVITTLDRQGRIAGRTEGLELDLAPLESTFAAAQR